MPATAPHARTFDFMGAFESLTHQAMRTRAGRGKCSFPEIHDVCLDRAAVIEYADQPGTEARIERFHDSVDAVSARYGWSVDSIIRTLDAYTKAAR